VLVTDHLVWHYPLQQPYDEAYTQEREEEEEIEDRRRNSRCSSEKEQTRNEGEQSKKTKSVRNMQLFIMYRFVKMYIPLC
tara:strand:- start:590 stop:829 length:240 start_codon:yes stop_codon:yes gene_type:complete